jgi:hypothetical protein
VADTFGYFFNQFLRNPASFLREKDVWQFFAFHGT